MLARFLRRPSLTLVGAVALVLAIANPAAAPPGDLDPTFDGDGKVTTDLAGSTDEGFAVAIQGDGKIVAAGSAWVDGTIDFALARYNTDGSLDTTFNADGEATTDFAGQTDGAFGVAIQGDGKIVAAGFATVSGNTDFALARYNTDGTLDTTFTGDGKTNTDFGTDDRANAVAIQGDGKIVAAGVSDVVGDNDFVMVRYQPNGTLDTTFSVDGTTFTDFGTDDRANAVAIQGDGKIVAAGFAVAGDNDFVMVRYQPNGTLDTTFSTDGTTFTDFAGGDDGAFGVAIQRDGKIVAAGVAFVSGTGDFALARYNTDGNPDTTFDGDGKLTTDFGGGQDLAFGVAIQGNGKIVAAGFATVSSGVVDFALAQYNTDGSLDPTFSGDGKVTTDFAGSTDHANAVAIQGDGKIVAAGFAIVAGNFDFALARYQGDPSGGGPGGGGPGGPGGGGPGGGPPTCAGRPATIIGTQAGDTLTGTPQKDVIVGLGGNDDLRALGGNDRICGGAGKDRMFGGRGSDRITGNAGADRLAGGPGGDNLNGGKGRDRCNGGPGTDKLRSCEVVAG